MDYIDQVIENAKASTNPLRAIRAFCIRCVATTHVEKVCCESDCPLFDFRTGKNIRRRMARELNKEATPKRPFPVHRFARKVPGDTTSLPDDLQRNQSDESLPFCNS